MTVGTQQFGKYILQRKLAEGGMAEVFLAKQTGPEFCEGFEKLVVIKRILPQLSSDDSFLKMFLNEARVAARLNHPNVVQIFDLGKLDDQYFIAMEYVHGEDLRTLIREATERSGKPPLALACRIIADTLAGLHYAHTRIGSDGKPLGLVHRDVSPQNVLVTYEGSIKLVDFGIAKATREVNAAQTQAGLLKGKYAYMSPEQARGQAVDARADVFCAGVLLWELTTWQRLFKRPTDMSTLMAVAEEPIRAPRTVDATLPPELDRLIVKALARDPAERFATAQEMRAALESLIRTSGWEADALALSTWMRELFAGKLHAQAADVAASGLSSLEDFLLTIEEKTAISWMEPPAAGRKTPSSGLPPSRPASGPQPATSYGDGPMTPQHSDGASSAELRRSKPDATTLRGNQTSPAAGVIVPPPPPGVMVPSPAALKSAPTAETLGVVAPATPPGSETPSMNLGSPLVPIFGPTRATAKQPVYAEPPSRLQRVLVAGSAAALVAAVALTVAFWPVKEPLPLPIAPAASGASAKPASATLQIHVDVAAYISVDGQAQPLGDTATVNVQPGVEHLVTVQLAGHPTRTLHVPALAPGEHMPLSFSVR